MSKFRIAVQDPVERPALKRHAARWGAFLTAVLLILIMALILGR